MRVKYKQKKLNDLRADILMREGLRRLVFLQKKLFFIRVVQQLLLIF